MEHYKSRNNDFFHFTNPHDDGSELDDDDDDYDELQYNDVDDEHSCDFNFHTFHPIGIAQSPPPDFQTSGVMNQNDTVTASVEEFGTFDKGALIFQLDNTMKNLSDKLQHAVEGIGTQISRLEDDTCKLDKYVEDVKNSVERYHGVNHRKLRQMQSILEEVQDDVLFLRDKHEIAETQLQLAKLQASKKDKINVIQTNPHSSSHIPFTARFDQPPSNLVTSSQSVSYHPAVSQAPEIPAQQYPIRQNLQLPHFTQSYQFGSFQELASPQNYPFLNHPSQETPNKPSYSHSSSIHHFPSEPARWGSTQEHEVSLTQSTHVKSSRNYKSEFHAKYMPEFATFPDISPRGEVPSLHEISNVKPVEFSNYTRTPVAQELPVALPMAVDVEDGSNSEENGNTISANDIIDKVTAMGFRRDLVRACVRKMKENESSVDLNSVLDRMMNNK